MAEQQSLGSSNSIAEGTRQAGQAIERSAERLEDTAVERVHALRSRVESNLEGRRGQTVERVRRVSDALRVASAQVEVDDPAVRDAFDYVSRRADRVARYLTDASLTDLRRDASEFAHRRPGLIFGGALLLGIAAGRMIKAEAPLVVRQPERTWDPTRSERERGTI